MGKAGQCWLMKSEPEVYSISDLQRDGRTAWTGVRNYQARNFMRDRMRVGDLVLFYHSNAEPSGVAGVGQVASAAYADPSQFVRGGEYAEPRATPENPVWFLVDVAFVEAFSRVVSLAELRGDVRLSGLMVLQRGSRLSIQPVEPAHFGRVVDLGRCPGWGASASFCPSLGGTASAAVRSGAVGRLPDGTPRGRSDAVPPDRSTMIGPRLGDARAG